MIVFNVKFPMPEFEFASVTVAVMELSAAAVHAVPERVGEPEAACEIPVGRPVTVHVNGAVVPPYS